MRPRPKDIDRAKERVLRFAKDWDRPIMIGEVSVMLGVWSLDETEELLNEMVDDDKTLRKITPKEARRFRRNHGYLRCK